MSLAADLTILKDLYQNVPKTRCVVSECGDWCCSRLPGCEDTQGHFISLPMLYSIEYQNMKQHILDTEGRIDIDTVSDIRNKMKMCSFRHRSAGLCGVYPVRPYSCHVYGRKVPPHFWGQDVPEEASRRIRCEDCHIVDDVKEKVHLQDYRQIWSQLAQLSMQNPLLHGKKQEVFQRITGLDNILIFGWHEFCVLDLNDEAWFESHFESFWSVYGSLL